VEGIWLPLVTPFEDGRLDEASLRRLLRRYLASPIDGFILAATTGEGLTLDWEETERLVAIASEEVAGRRPLYLGLSGSDTRKLLKALAATARWPVDGYLVACPYYTRPSQEGLRLHFTALAERSDRPILVYNIPYRTGVNMANETLLRLAELPAIAGVKDCCASQAQSFELLCRRPRRLSVMTGEDALVFTALAQGADGGILATAHLDPEGFAAIRNDLLTGRRRAALERWHGLAELAALAFAEPSPAPIKYWLWREGLIASPELRLPMTPVSGALAARIDDEIARRPVPRKAEAAAS
jgi:4-hydroxy-tetrahydrodipicolinate synthase